MLVYYNNKMISRIIFLLFSISTTITASTLPIPGIYSLAQTNNNTITLFHISLDGTRTPIGTPLFNSSFIPSQGLSVLDTERAILYTILAESFHNNQPSLVSIILSTGIVKNIIPLPLVNGVSIGMGQVIALIPSSGDILVAGTNVEQNEAIYRVNPSNGTIHLITTLNASIATIAPTCAVGAYDPIDNTLYIGADGPAPNYDRLALRIDIPNGTMKKIRNPESGQILSYFYNTITDTIVGLGSKGAKEETIIAQLFTTNNTIAIIGTIPSLLYDIAGFQAVNITANTLAWIGSANADGPYSLVVNSLHPGAPIVSQAEICKTLEDCNILTWDIYG